MNGKSFDISDGKIDGDKFSFKVVIETKQGDKTAVYEGTVEGDHLKGTTKFRGSASPSPSKQNERIETGPNHYLVAANAARWDRPSPFAVCLLRSRQTAKCDRLPHGK
jgi:hypothetical protein